MAERGVLDRDFAEYLVHLSFYPVGTVVELTDGRVGVVAANHPNRMDPRVPGRPVVVLHATNIDFMNNSAQIVAQRLRAIGVNAELATSDWGGVVTRRAVKSPPDQGGWNIFITWAGGAAVGNPIALAGHAATGDKGWFGWPADETNEKLRDKWAAATTLDEQKAVAREIQRNAWNFVPHVWLGQWVAPVAYRANVRGFLPIPEVIPFWNVEKT